MESPSVRDLYYSGTLLILGNGFDLDLGFKTRYEDFFKSDKFPFVNHDESCHDLGHFIYDCGVQEKWYDLENLLGIYGAEKCSTNADIEGDKEDFHRIIDGFASYLKNVIFLPDIDVHSVAARVLKAADTPLLSPQVYSFNYTNFDEVTSQLHLSNFSCKYVHGSLNNPKSIVLGVGEYVNLKSNATYLYKTSNPRYNSQNLLTVYPYYDTIIIYGLSMSQVDYPYFEDFFRDVAERTFMGDRRKYIRIFTYDEQSRMDILDNIRKMNSGLVKLVGYSDFDIIRTKDNIDETKVREVIHHLEPQWEVLS